MKPQHGRSLWQASASPYSWIELDWSFKASRHIHWLSFCFLTLVAVLTSALPEKLSHVEQ